MIETLNSWDQQLMLLLNGDGGVFWDQFWYIYSYKFTWIPLYILLVWLMILHCHKDKKLEFWRHLAVCVFCTVMLIVLSDQIASGVIKPWVCRPRPSHEPGLMDLLHYVNDYHGGAYGFVSSHASNSLAIALWIGWLLKNRKMQILLILWALLNCYSRIYLGVHYPGDIFGGLFVGWVSFLIIRLCYQCVVRRFL